LTALLSKAQGKKYFRDLVYRSIKLAQTVAQLRFLSPEANNR
jgi:hypothetical protein